MPTGTEETETGEKFEDNALPWDSIDAATFGEIGDLRAFGPELLKNHNDRREGCGIPVHHEGHRTFQRA
ncbi:carboxy terminal-processing peptidase [Shigella flexneri]